MHISERLNYNFLFDSHCHLNEASYDVDREEVINNASNNGIELILDTSVNVKSAKKSVEISKSNSERVKSWVGIDPEIFVPGSELFEEGNLNISPRTLPLLKKQLQDLIDENKEFIVGIGECGMDYYWLEQSRVESKELIVNSKKLQQQLFELHLELAQEFKLPLTIHSRGAENECIEMVQGYDVTGIFHSYTRDYETAKRILDLGFGLGVNGIITFPNANELRNVYKQIIGHVGAEQRSDLQNNPEFFYKKGIFFETDSPFLAPQSKRGQRNKPENIKEIYESFIKMLL